MEEPRYFTNIGPAKGSILSRDRYGASGVMATRDNHIPIGMALGVTWDDQGRQLLRLTVNKVELPGLWVVVNREFRRWPTAG
jgi:hypothetical protein